HCHLTPFPTRRSSDLSSIDGQPGMDTGIRLRGAGSTSQNSSNALIVIDGVPAEHENALSSINPKDIESISVLKDAASTAVYGSRSEEHTSELQSRENL